MGTTDMEIEPKVSRCGLHLVTIKEFKFVLVYTRKKRGKRNYVVAWPETEIEGDWESCMADCELYAVNHSARKSHRKVRSRRRS